MRTNPNRTANLAVLLAATALAVAGYTARAVDRYWSGATESYTNAANWTGAAVPGTNDVAINDNGSNNVVQINVGNPDWAIGGLRAGSTAGASGAFSQSGQAVTLGGNRVSLGVSNASVGVYTLTGGSISNLSQFNVGEIGQGLMSISGGDLTGSSDFHVNTGGGYVVSNTPFITASMDGGLNKNGHTWSEAGLYAPDTTRGIPAAGSTFVSESQADHSYTMAPSYAGNSCVMLSTAAPNATITLTTPAIYSGLSFLGSGGNGGKDVSYTIHYADATTETGTFTILDWFSGAGIPAKTVGCRIVGDGSNFQLIGGNPKLFSFDIFLSNLSTGVVSIDLTLTNVTSGAACILAVSGTTGGNFDPIAISGYNQDMIVEASAVFAQSSVTDQLDQTGGAITINNNAQFRVGNLGSGVYNLHGGTNTTDGYFVVGRFGGNGVMTMDGGHVNKLGGEAVIVADNAGSVGLTKGRLEHSAGTIYSDGEFWVGQGVNTLGTNNMSGTAVLTVNNWVAIGRGGGNGVMTMSGGSLTKNGGGDLIVGDNSTGYFQQLGGTVSINNTLRVGNGGSTGTYDLSGGSVTISGGEFWIGQGGGSFGTNNISGGSLTVNNNWISIGRNGGTGTLNLTNGILTKLGNGNFSIGGDGGATGTLNQYGGTISNAVNPGSATYVGQGGGNGTWTMNGGTNVLGLLRLCENGSGSGTVNFNGGMLSVSEVNAGGVSSTFNFNGGTLRARGDNTSFFHGLGLASLQAGGAIFDSQGYDITVAQSLSDSGGGVTKNGSGSVTFTGYAYYGGPTFINAGTMSVTLASSIGIFAGSGDYTVADSAGLGVNVQEAFNQMYVPSLTLGSSGAVTLNLPMALFADHSTAPIYAAALTNNATVTVHVPTGVFTVGSIPLISYASHSGAGTYVTGTLPDGVAGYVTNNASTFAVELVITAAAAPRWDGTVNGDWDIDTTTNWVDIATASPAVFKNGHPVIFNDDATGVTAVNVATNVIPGSVSFNNSSLAYSLDGPGKITGVTSVSKTGSASVTISNVHSFTGPVTVSGGTLEVLNLANGGVDSSIGASSLDPANLVLSGATLAYSGPNATTDRGYTVASNSVIQTLNNLTISGVAVAGAGAAVTKTGAGQLAYTGPSNTLANAAYRVEEGSLLLSGPAGGQTNHISAALNINGTVTSSVTLTNTTLNCGDVYVGNESGKSGAITIEAGTVINDNSWFILNNATATINGGEINVPNGRLFLCDQPGTMATLNINGGVINKNSGDIICIADGGWNGSGARTGIVNQVAGTLNVSPEVQIGQVALGKGIYNLHGGEINSTGWFVIGRAGGDGTFNMDGGTFTHTSGGQPALIVGSGAGNNSLASVGVLDQSGGTINCTSEYWVGENTLAVGTNNISGTAEVNVANWVSLGRGGHAVVNFSGGTFTKTGNGNFIIGDNGNAHFKQTGGTLSINSELWIGQAGGGVGQYDLTNGTVTVDSWVAVGRAGATGTLNISGGSLTKAGSGDNHITIGSGGPGTVNQTGGTITSTQSSTFIGEGGQPGVWNISGGSAELSTVYLPINIGANGTLNLNGGTFSATEITSTNAGGTGTLNFNGGTLVAGNGASANFLHDISTNMVLSGGAVIDSGTNVISVAQALLDGGGGGGLTKLGTGTLYLNGVNTYTGLTVVSNGTLGGTGSIAGSVELVSGTTLAPGASVGTLTIGGNLSIGGNVAVELGTNGNDLVNVTGGLTNTASGTVSVSLIGTNVTAGNVYTLFNKPVVNGNLFTVTGSSVTWSNNLAVDGSIIALTGSVSTTPVPIVSSYSNNVLNLSWPADHTGWSLLVQTNLRSVGLSTNWSTWPGSASTNAVSIPVNATNPTVFFRLVYP